MNKAILSPRATRSKRANNARKPKAEVASALLTVRVTRSDMDAWKAAAAMVG